ncbi:uncharacterized protein LOC589695 [Strongylocentrotus purpuratus]|uniref:EGF-like domain-containing protein n=1 Tax=Strongylocentrotus purpuratus TaxID=7668 RepID=A0A7M7MYG0_STRPU|nr:uncharacterized protein LOC589695 [Strongylocentrotus purpuratus]
MGTMKGVYFLLAVFVFSSVDGKLTRGRNDQYIGKHIVGTPLIFAMNANYEIYDGFSSRVFDRKDEHSGTSSGSASDDEEDERRRRKKRSTSFSAEEIQGILDRHNLLRGQVSPEAANMEFMSWDDDLASMAQDWSDECLWEHGNPTNISPFSSVGQNLWLGTGSQPDGVGPTQSWYNEDQYYDYDTHSCSDVCGHYTQVVWDDTYAVGCGRTFCSSVSNGWTNAYIVTCNYGPAGNYNGVRPYTTGSSCTQCASGIGQCYDNQCRLCSEHSETCDCQAVCQNCGTLNNDCTCTCRDGYYGSDCSTVCEDTHEYCGGNPGWPLSWCTEDRSYVLTNCPLFCGLCNAADPSQTCESTSAPSAATTSSSGSGDVTTTSSGSSDVTTMTTTVETTTAQPSCDTTCQNDGIVDETTCECDCPSDYQGAECEQTKSQVRYGVVVYTSISRWPDLEDILLRIIGEIVTSWCNDNFEICCPNQGTLSSSSSTLGYVDETHVTVADGFPREETGLSFDAFRVMLLVTPPETTELCSAGSDSNSATRRRRWTEYLHSNMISKRDASENYLDQDALYEAVSENIDTLEDELNVTLGEVVKGEIEPDSGSGGGLAAWAIALIVVVVLLVVVIVLGIVVFITMKEKRVRTMSPNVKSERDEGKPTSSAQ